MTLSPDTITEITKLADELKNRFAPPELIVGCEVMSIADVNEYAANNGWIEAVCGRHNQQRCRWKGKAAEVQVGDFVDVLYFKSFKLFEVLGIGGTGAIAQGGNVWPRADRCGISEEQYDTWAAFIAALGAGEQGIVGEGTFVTDWSGGERLVTGAHLRGCGIDISILEDGGNDLFVLEAEGTSVIQDIKIHQTYSSGSAAFYADSGADVTLISVKVEDDYNDGGFYFDGAVGQLFNCIGLASGGFPIYAGSSSLVEIFGGYYDGEIIATGSSQVTLYGPTIDNAVFTTASGGIIKGWYYDTDGKLYTIGNETGLMDVVNGIMDGRLTLTSGTPVSDATAATTLYYTPFIGNRVTLYTNLHWELYEFTERSIAIPATTNTNYDVFLYDNAGTLTLSLTAWATDTTRATALTTQDGVLVKSGAVNYRYLGTIRTTTSSGQCDDITIARYVWNFYNQVRKNLTSYNTNVSWNIVAATPIQEFNAGGGQVRAKLVTGQAQQLFVNMNGYVSACQNGFLAGLYIGFDTTATLTNPGRCVFLGTAGSPVMIIGPAHCQVNTGIGYHYLTQLEYTSGTATIYPGSGAYSQLISQVRC